MSLTGSVWGDDYSITHKWKEGYKKDSFKTETDLNPSYDQ